MVYVALLGALIALVLAWRCSRALKVMKERNARLSSQLYDLRLELKRAAEAHQSEIIQLRFDLLRWTGDLKVREDMTVDEVVALHPQATAILAGFHIGGCASCAVDGSTRLDQAVAANGGRLEPLLVALNTLVATGGDGLLTEEQLRVPNVQMPL